MKTRMEEPVPTHRSSSPPENSPSSSNLVMDKEGAHSVEGIKEGCIFGQNRDIDINEVSISDGEVSDIPVRINIGMDTPVVNEVNMEEKKAGKYGRKYKKRGGEKHTGPAQEKFISLDNRPTSKKKAKTRHCTYWFGPFWAGLSVGEFSELSEG
ncbi:hypothetical protein Hanom_Chr05g00387141 [Helianthus anomalus]